MQEFLEYEFLSWLQFSMIAFAAGLVLLVLSRIPIFKKYFKRKSIGFRMFKYMMTILIVVSFLLIRPIYHLLFLIVVFGLFYYNIVSYSRALFSLYFSNVKFGDKISIGGFSGTLDNMNFGGLHLLTNDNKVYFPFNKWKENKIILESEYGTVLISFECTDAQGRNDHHAISDLEKSLFNYPFLAVSNVTIEKEANVFKVATRISDPKYKGGLLNHIDKAGFHLNGNKI